MRRMDLSEPVRQRLRRYPPPYDAHYGVVPAPPEEGPVHVGDFGPLVDAAERALRRLGNLPGGRGAMPFLISRILVREEAVSSSSIEGTHSTLDALLELEENGEGDSDTRLVRSYAVTLEWALGRLGNVVPPALEEDIFTLDFVRELHRRAMAEDVHYRDEPGNFRDQVVWIGGSGAGIERSTWNPPAPDQIRPCLEATMRYMRGEGGGQIGRSILVHLAVAHAHFEAVHPFHDGNGRVGRLLIPLMLKAAGHRPLYVSNWIEHNKQKYYDGLKEAQQRGNHVPLVAVMAEAVQQSVERIEAVWAETETLIGHWVKINRLRKNSAAERTLAILPEYPVLTVRRLAALLGISFKATNTGVGKLVEAGILREKTGYERNRVFVAQAILDLYAAPTVE